MIIAEGPIDLAALAAIGVPGILTLGVLAVLFGWMFPRAAVTRLWKELDDKTKENAELRGTLDRQAGLIEKVTDQMGDLKVALQATLYAMQEIQAAGRYAAGMEALPRTSMQKSTDEEA